MIIGTALGAWALFGNRRSSVIGGLGTSGSGMLDGANININGLSTAGNGITSPSAFQAWEKGCEDTLALQKGLYDWALVQQSQRFADRQTIDSELFKSWFGEDIDQKVIEAAILFWFKDDDCKSNSKLWNHFKEN